VDGGSAEIRTPGAGGFAASTSAMRSSAVKPSSLFFGFVERGLAMCLLSYSGSVFLRVISC
jgi:hypothetical protein